MIQPIGNILISLSMQQDLAGSGVKALIGELLRKHFHLSEEALYRALAIQFSLPFVERITSGPEPDLLHEIPAEILKEARFYPLSRLSGIVSVIIGDPLDLDSLTTVAAFTGSVPEARLTTPSELSRAIEALFAGDSVLKQSMGNLSREYAKQLHTDETQLSIEEIKRHRI